MSQSAHVIGNDLYHRALNECLPEHRDLMETVWSPTPWMLDVFVEGREQEIRRWCYRRLGCESSPLHNKEGAWHLSYVTLKGWTWLGFKNERTAALFEATYPSPKLESGIENPPFAT